MNYPDDFINKIICGDCLEVMKQMPDKCVDLVLTDPPYEKEAHTPKRRTRQAVEHGVDCVIPFDCIDEVTREAFIKECSRVSMGWAIVFCQAEAVARYKDLSGSMYRRPMVWIKPDSAAQYTGDRPAMGYESIIAAWCGEGKSKWNGGGMRGVFQYNCTDYKHEHPTQKPIRLIKRLVDLFSNKDELVLDCFSGSGTTAVACKELGRNFIGIEKEPKYCAIAEERLRILDMQPKLL